MTSDAKNVPQELVREERGPNHFVFRFSALGGVGEIQCCLLDSEKATAAVQTAVDEILRIEKKFSRYVEDSVIAAINKNAGGKPVSIDEETAGLLSFADACHRESRGLFDITSGVLRRVWNFGEPRIPAQTEIDAVLPLIGWEKVEWDKKQIRLPVKGMEIDFGGFGKEYAVDRAAAELLEKGVTSGIVNLAGDVRAIGKRGDGGHWRAGIQHPRQPGAVASTVELNDIALATSGDYERYFEVNGRRYCHILNAKVGWPVSHFQSVAVIAPTCLVAGSLATVAMLIPPPLGIEILKSTSLPFFVVDSAGKVIQSKR